MAVVKLKKFGKSLVLVVPRIVLILTALAVVLGAVSLVIPAVLAYLIAFLGAQLERFGFWMLSIQNNFLDWLKPHMDIFEKLGKKMEAWEDK